METWLRCVAGEIELRKDSRYLQRLTTLADTKGCRTGKVVIRRYQRKLRLAVRIPPNAKLSSMWRGKERATLHSVLPTSLLWLRRRRLVDELTDGFKVMLVLLAMHLWMGRHQHIATRIHHQHNVPRAALMSGREAPKSVGCCL